MEAVRHLLSHFEIGNTPRHCATCLFVLPTKPVSDNDPSLKVTPLPTDIEPPINQVFASSDTHQVPASHLADSAHRGCPTCHRLLSYLEKIDIWERCTSLEWFPANLIGQDEPGKLVCHLSPAPLTSASDKECPPPEDSEHVTLELCRSSSSNARQADLASIHPSLRDGTPLPLTSTSSPTTLSLAKSWLDNCKLNHASTCATDAPDSPRFTPTRLLYISPETAVLHDPPPPSTPYATLSHRWSASTASVILTLANLSVRVTEGIRITDLPPLMRDAVHAVRALGLEWVWIDSLCIVQDSPEDWKREAGMMAGVYMGAEVTVAATGSGGEGGGMFTSGREGEEVGEMGGGLFVRKGVDHFRWLNGVGVVEDGDEGQWPLLGRGWVYQEQWLSRRMVHFTKREVAWVCKRAMACECGWYQFEAAGSEEANEDHDRDVDGTRPREWREIVEEYSQRNFTRITDRLPALAGIATVYAAATTPGRYICGLWESDLPGNLFWHPKTGTPVSARPEGTMPTWSWASTAGAVEFQYVDDESARTKVLSIDVTYSGSDLMGEVVDAAVRVSGPVVDARAYHGRRWKQVLATEGISWGEESLERAGGLSIGENLITFAPDYVLTQEGFLVPEEADVVCLLLSSNTVGSWDPDHPEANTEVEFASGLVLWRILEGSDCYQRIGHFEGWGLEDGFELDVFNALSQVRTLVLV
ncbi:heterokaryon incompatibility protein-domain-containing protein [Podospora conica]|nr:heterokaryon incompatibility protein-domain-containing protein [Schizothecium conicum]